MSIQVRSILSFVALAGLTLMSTLADARVIRKPGAGSVVAPPAPGEIRLVDISYADPLAMPVVGDDYVFGNGFAPHVTASQAGPTLCDPFVYLECWGEYLPDETAVFGGVLWGGQLTADMTYELRISDRLNTVLYTFPGLPPADTVGDYYDGYDTPGNPCVGVFLYGGTDIGCQYFEMSMALPDTLEFGEWYYAQWYGTYTAPTGMHFAMDENEDGFINSVSDTMFGFSERFKFKRVSSVDEGPAIVLIVAGGMGIAFQRRRRRRPAK